MNLLKCTISHIQKKHKFFQIKLITQRMKIFKTRNHKTGREDSSPSTNCIWNSHNKVGIAGNETKNWPTLGLMYRN